MKLTKIIVMISVSFIALLAFGCASYAQVGAYDSTPEMWDAVQNDQPATITGSLPAIKITYTTEVVSAGPEQVYKAAFEVLATIDPSETPQITRVAETGKAISPYTLKKVKSADEKDFDNTKRGELLGTYKTKSMSMGAVSMQNDQKRVRIVVLPQDDGTTKIGTWIGSDIRAYKASDLLSRIKEKL